MDRWARFSHFCYKIRYHSFHPSIRARNLTPILWSLWTTPYYFLKKLGFNFRPSLQTQCPCQIYGHPGFTPYQHPQCPYWYQLQKETTLITYMLIIQCLFMYEAPIWFPNTSLSLIQNLRSIQNSALCIANGCVTMTLINHLHKEKQKCFLSNITFP